MENLEEKRYWIWLSLINGIGARKKRKLLEKYNFPQKIYQLTKKDLVSSKIMSEDIADNFCNMEIKNSVYKHIEYMQKHNIDIINITDKNYPSILKEIYDPPISLYIKGNKEILSNKSIGIVGCRIASDYGIKAAKYFSYNLAKDGYNIISGLARGIDSYSHIGCIASNGKTIAVVGNGLDTIYPRENDLLAKKIIENNGAIISEYPLGTKPEKSNFPARNRIISGLSQALIVVEAKEKSGSLITADFALEQGKSVYAVPGNINSINSVGTNDLIKQGAIPATCYNDVIQNLYYE